LKLSLNVAYPIPENIELLLQTAFQQAFNLSLNAAFPTSETIAGLLRKAHIEALSLNAKIGELEEKITTSAESTQKG